MKSLPLTPLETYFYEDDVPAHPCWQIQRLKWRGHFKREELERSWSEITRLQPLWSAVVRRGFLGRLRWEGGGAAPTIHWCRGKAGEEWPAWLPLDLEHGPGVRLYVVEWDQRTDIVLCAHHAICDGISLVEVLEDVFLHYAKSLGDSVEPKPRPPEDALRKRGRFGASFIEQCWLPVLQTAGILAESRLLRRTVAPLLPHAPAPSSTSRPEEWPALVARSWSEAESVAIRNAAKSKKSGLSETLMRDLQAAIGAWRGAQGVNSPDDWIRLGTAVSLRRKGPSPAANIFGIAVIDRAAKQLANRERLLRRAGEDMELITKWKLGYAFWTLLSLRQWWPGGIRSYARRKVVRMTIVMSFFGKVYSRTPLRREGKFPAVPGAVLDCIQGLAPTRPGTGGCVDLAIIFDKLEACLHFDPRMMTRAQAEALMDEFAAQLARTVAGS
jgi:hypothetical protein